MTTTTGAVDAVVAGDGTLAYVSGRRCGGAGAPRTLVWVDRQGRETPIPAPPRAYVYPRLSPDGTRIAVFADDQESDIWVWDLGRTTLTRVTFDPAFDIYPVWTPDGAADLQFGPGGRTESLLAGGGRHRRGRAADRESQRASMPSAVSPDGAPADFHRDRPRRRART